jgi:hypothetical protein
MIQDGKVRAKLDAKEKMISLILHPLLRVMEMMPRRVNTSILWRSWSARTKG